MASLTDVISQPDRRKQVVSDAGQLLDQEVDDKSGLSGMAIKGAYAIVKGMKPGIIPEVIDGLLPDFCKAVDGVIGGRPAGTDIESYINSKTNDVVQGLLATTDARAQKTTHQTMLKAYQRLRPMAEKQVAAAVPRVAKMVAKHVAAFEKTA